MPSTDTGVTFSSRDAESSASEAGQEQAQAKSIRKNEAEMIGVFLITLYLMGTAVLILVAHLILVTQLSLIIISPPSQHFLIVKHFRFDVNNNNPSRSIPAPSTRATVDILLVDQRPR